MAIILKNIIHPQFLGSDKSSFLCETIGIQIFHSLGTSSTTQHLMMLFSVLNFSLQSNKLFQTCALMSDSSSEILGVAIIHREHFCRNVIVFHRLFERAHRILQSFSSEVRIKNHLGTSLPSKRMVWFLGFDNPLFKKFIASPAVFIPIFLFSVRIEN